MKASATRIARSVLSDYVDLRADGLRVAMHVLMVAREQMTRAINALTALVRTVEFGVDARKSLSCSQITAIMTWRTRSEDATAATCHAVSVSIPVGLDPDFDDRECDTGCACAADQSTVRAGCGFDVPSSACGIPPDLLSTSQVELWHDASSEPLAAPAGRRRSDPEVTTLESGR